MCSDVNLAATTRATQHAVAAQPAPKLAPDLPAAMLSKERKAQVSKPTLISMLLTLGMCLAKHPSSEGQSIQGQSSASGGRSLVPHPSSGASPAAEPARGVREQTVSTC